ncbi:DNA glycosylase, partial [Eremomyces bilateralis CBS 781.70]
MRADIVAPVDTMGCATLADPTASARDQRFQTLVALMLSSQTKDVVTAAAMGRLREEVPGVCEEDRVDSGFNLESILALPAPRLNELIAKVGFHNVKTAYILRTAAILRDEHDSDIPATIVGLTSLPGVGPKMAYLCLSAAWGRDEGIGVDVHVHRITNRWGWNRTKGPEETRKALEGWLPRDKWNEINHLLVGFGQTICAPVRPRCGECGLAEKGLCPSAKVVKGKSSVVKKE